MIELYLSDLSLPVFVGKPNSEQEKMINCWEETVEFMLYNLKSDVRVSEICGQAIKIFEKHSLSNCGSPRFGHGLGTCARLRPFLSTKSEDVLKPGMVFALGTGILRPNFGGLRLEYPVLITDSKAEPLCMTPARVHRVKG
jgi:Xaa-Pro aminopeptidase